MHANFPNGTLATEGPESPERYYALGVSTPNPTGQLTPVPPRPQ